MRRFQLSSAAFGTSCQRPKPQANIFFFFAYFCSFLLTPINRAKSKAPETVQGAGVYFAGLLQVVPRLDHVQAASGQG